MNDYNHVTVGEMTEFLKEQNKDERLIILGPGNVALELKIDKSIHRNRTVYIYTDSYFEEPCADCWCTGCAYAKASTIWPTMGRNFCKHPKHGEYVKGRQLLVSSCIYSDGKKCPHFEKENSSDT